ncbi:YveK family protein [Nocardiopsis alba]|uniref:YveK family protein n=1 Tax=Nocardiopsis alba TaxID=53437 RepID=UPI0036716732
MATDVPGPSGPELKEYTALLRRRRRLVVAGVLGGLVLAGAGAFAVPSTYTSVTAVQVHPTGMAEFTGERSGRLTGDVNLDSEAQVVLSDRVAGAAAEEIPGSPSAEDVREHVDVTVPPNSNIMELHYSARSPETARTGAAALADAYLEQRGTQVRNLIDGHLETLRAEQQERYDALSETAPGDSNAGESARADALRQEIGDLGNMIGPLGALRETVSPGQVLTPADLPASASSPIPALWIVAGAALGLLAGLLTAVVRDRLDPRLRDTEDTARIAGLPVLLDLSTPGTDPDRTPGLLTEADTDGRRADELAHLIRARASVGGASVVDGVSASGQVIVVTGTTPGRSGIAAAVNLAAALARGGSDTLLVCADPRADSMNALLGLDEGPGLAEILVDGENPDDLVVRPSGLPRLRALRYGRPGVTAPFQGGAAELVDLLRPRAEFVVIVTASAGERADAHALAAHADLLLPVVELGRSRREVLNELITAGSRFGVAVPGSITVPRQPAPAPLPESVPSAPPRPAEADTSEAEAEKDEETNGSDSTPSVGAGAASAGSRR